MDHALTRRAVLGVTATAGLTAGIGTSLGAPATDGDLTERFSEQFGSDAWLGDVVAQDSGSLAAGQRGSSGWLVSLAADGSVDSQTTLDASADGQQPAFGSVSYLNAITRTPNGAVAVGADERNGTRRGIVVGLDETLDERWRAVIDDAAGTECRGVTATNGLVAVAGTVNGAGALALGFDDSGTRQWTSSFEQDRQAAFNDVLAIDDGLAFIGASIRVFGADIEGTVVWSDRTGELLARTAVTEESSLDLLAADTVGTETLLCLARNRGRGQSWLYRIDPETRAVTGSALVDDTPGTLSSIDVTETGTVLAGSNGTEALLVGVNAAGERIWQRTNADATTALGTSTAQDLLVVGTDGTDTDEMVFGPGPDSTTTGWAAAYARQAAISAAFTVSPTAPTTADTISVDAGESTPGEVIDSVEWAFGDGTTATGVTATHSYDSAGSFDITVTVESTDGRTDEATRTIEVTAASDDGGGGDDGEDGGNDGSDGDDGNDGGGGDDGNDGGDGDDGNDGGDGDDGEDGGNDGQAPTAEFTIDPQSPETGAFVEFDASPSTPGDAIDSVEWALGDGTEATGLQVIHAYTSADTYDVTLTVRTASGQQDERTRTVTVQEGENEGDDGEPGPAPDAALAVTPDSPAPAEQVQFDASESTPAREQIVRYGWKFGDGTTGQGRSTTHAYDTPGEYTVTLGIQTTDGQTDTATRAITVGNAGGGGGDGDDGGFGGDDGSEDGDSNDGGSDGDTGGNDGGFGGDDSTGDEGDAGSEDGTGGFGDGSDDSGSGSGDDSSSGSTGGGLFGGNADGSNQNDGEGPFDDSDVTEDGESLTIPDEIPSETVVSGLLGGGVVTHLYRRLRGGR